MLGQTWILIRFSNSFSLLWISSAYLPFVTYIWNNSISSYIHDAKWFKNVKNGHKSENIILFEHCDWSSSDVVFNFTTKSFFSKKFSIDKLADNAQMLNNKLIRSSNKSKPSSLKKNPAKVDQWMYPWTQFLYFSKKALVVLAFYLLVIRALNFIVKYKKKTFQSSPTFRFQVIKTLLYFIMKPDIF